MQHPASSQWQQKWLRLDCYRPELVQLGNTVEAYCGRWYRNDTVKPLLVLAGEPNCAKTHCARAIYRFCRKAAFGAFCAGYGKTWAGTTIPSCQYVLWPEVAVEVEANNRSALADMVSVDMLVLDDVGAENDPWKKAADALCQVLTRRERRWTVVTTNVEPAAWPDRFDARIADRLMRYSEVVNLFGIESYALRGGK